MADWVHAAERAYVAAATGQPAPRGGPPEQLGRARAAIGAIASHYLAIGTPRSLGLIVDDPGLVDEAALSLVAHRTWFKPSDLRCAGDAGPALAASIAGRATSVAEALACDIVCVHAPIALDRALLRRGSHINVLATATFDDELAAIATLVHEHPGLGALAAGLVDGRQLDELTVFVIGDAQLALAAVHD